MMSQEERYLLKKLASGMLDGKVGDEREFHCYRSIFCGKLIRNGIPISYRQGELSGFAGEDGTREEKAYETDEQKLVFLQRYGWLMEDEDAKAYSRKYKGAFFSKVEPKFRRCPEAADKVGSGSEKDNNGKEGI